MFQSKPYNTVGLDAIRIEFCQKCEKEFTIITKLYNEIFQQ